MRLAVGGDLLHGVNLPPLTTYSGERACRRATSSSPPTATRGPTHRSTASTSTRSTATASTPSSPNATRSWSRCASERFGTDADVFAGSDEFQAEWFGEDEDGNSLHELGLRGGWDAKKRDEELSADGVTGEVVFPGPDAVTGKMGAPFGAGFAIDATADPELVLAGARAYNRWAAELCAESPQRRAGLIVAPILGDIDGAMAEITRAHDEGLWGGVIIPAQWGELSVVHELPVRPDLGAV